MADNRSRSKIGQRLEALRAEMRRLDLCAYLVPSADPHQSEYVPAAWRRRTRISDFTGSAGTAIVTRDAALLFTDSRYWLQAAQELPEAHYTLVRHGAPGVLSPEDWLEAEFGDGARIGVDPRLVTQEQWRSFARRLERKGATLVAIEENLVDRGWPDRPPLPAEPVSALPVEFAGRPSGQKLGDLREAMSQAACDAHVVTALDSIAWLFNIRGRDIECNPLAISYALVRRRGAQLFADPAKLDPALRAHLGDDVEVLPYDHFERQLEQLAASGARVWVDPGSASTWVVDRLTGADGSGARLYEKDSPIELAKAIKNEVELAGMRACHVRDGVAVCRFLRWLEDELESGASPDEVRCAERLFELRAQGDHFQGISFGTISAYGANGAIVHYSPRRADCAKLEPVGLYLLDSGAQYLDGTTDITRTVALGPLRAEHRDRFTRVLRGHIAVSTARFPEGATGSQIDSLARKPLWDAGLDYGHGTGHGVGHFLCVHEGPQAIAPRSTKVPLAPGMILSNEPGYYETNAYGIRLENLIEVVEREPGANGVHFYGFDTLTLCPIDLRCVDTGVLAPEERSWLDAYHARVRETLGPQLDDPADQRWLERATQPA
jgi:Xaa-Pro aminopeptidase